MPIYTYLCPHCNRLYDFLSRTVTPRREPVCPRCGATDLAKQVTRFAVVRGGGDEDADGGFDDDAFGGGPDPLADPRNAAEMERLMADAEHLDDDNPRELGRFMRRMSELAGEPIGAEMEEALRRLEAGEDPDRVEDDMGDLLGELPPDGTHEGPAGDAAYGVGGGEDVGADGGDVAAGMVSGDGPAAAVTTGSAGDAQATSTVAPARPSPRPRPVKDKGLYDL